MAVDTMAAEADLSLEDLQPIQQSLVKYVLAWQESEEDGIAEAEVIVVMTRAEGFLLALPLDFVAEDTLALGAIFDERPLGMSKVVTVPAVMQEAGSISPLGVQMSVVLVDCASSLVVSLRPYVAPEEAIARFLEDDPDAFPDPARVTEEALRWMGEATDFSPVYPRGHGRERGGAGSRKPFHHAAKSKSSSRWGYTYRKAQGKETNHCQSGSVDGDYELSYPGVDSETACHRRAASSTAQSHYGSPPEAIERTGCPETGEDSRCGSRAPDPAKDGSRFQDGRSSHDQHGPTLRADGVGEGQAPMDFRIYVELLLLSFAGFGSSVTCLFACTTLSRVQLLCC